MSRGLPLSAVFFPNVFIMILIIFAIVFTRLEHWRLWFKLHAFVPFLSFHMCCALEPGLLLFSTTACMLTREFAQIFSPNWFSRRFTQKTHLDCETFLFFSKRTDVVSYLIHTFKFNRQISSYGACRMRPTVQWMQMITAPNLRSCLGMQMPNALLLSSALAPLRQHMHGTGDKRCQKVCICSRWWITSKEKFSRCACAGCGACKLQRGLPWFFLRDNRNTSPSSVRSECSAKSNCQVSIDSISSNCSQL